MCSLLRHYTHSRNNAKIIETNENVFKLCGLVKSKVVVNTFFANLGLL
jgi:hypothetical protein